MELTADTQALKCIRILLVEDNPADVELAQEALKDSKIFFSLDVAADGEAAMEYLRREGKYKDVERPDLIILDLNLPRKDGREVLKEIKEDPDLLMIPVVILTVSKADEDAIKAYNLHANCFINKPIDFTQFTKVVQSIEDFWFTIVRLPPRGYENRSCRER